MMVLDLYRYVQCVCTFWCIHTPLKLHMVPTLMLNNTIIKRETLNSWVRLWSEYYSIWQHLTPTEEETWHCRTNFTFFIFTATCVTTITVPVAATGLLTCHQKPRWNCLCNVWHLELLLLPSGGRHLIWTADCNDTIHGLVIDITTSLPMWTLTNAFPSRPPHCCGALHLNKSCCVCVRLRPHEISTKHSVKANVSST